MNKLFKLVEYAYLIIGLFLIEEAIRTWGEEESKSYLYIVLAIFAVFMFFFRRWYRHKAERENRNQ